MPDFGTRLDQQVKQDLDHVYSDHSRSTYNTKVLWFLRFVFWMGWAGQLSDMGFVAAVLVHRYATFLAQTQSFKSVKLSMNGVRIYYENRGIPNPLANNSKHKLHMKALRRKLGDVDRPKLPVTPRVLGWLTTACDKSCPREVAFTAAALIAFFAFLRKSNVTTGRTQPEEISHALKAGDVAVDDANYRLIIRLRCTKTIQFGERELLIPISGIRGSPI